MQEEHPNYVAIWGWLTALLAVSIGMAFIGHAIIASILIFAVAFLKAYLVAGYYMHLKFEPRVIQVVVLFALFLLLVLWAGLAPDVAYGPRG